jgi:peptidoglycan hydrolase FlgJ
MENGMLPVDIGAIARNARDSDAMRAVEALRGKSDVQAIRKAAEEFEAVFVAQMMAPMFETLESDTLFGGGPGEDIYRSMMVEEYGKVIARSGGIGIADAVARELLGIQEAAQNE